MAEGKDQRNYYSKWYQDNKEKLAKRRKKKYRSDPDHAEKQRDRVRAGYQSRTDERTATKLARLERRKKEEAEKVGRSINSRIVEVEGDPVEVFSTGALTIRLGIAPDTLRRKWHAEEIIPEATFKDDSGRRWYSQAYLDFMERMMYDVWIHSRSLEEFSAEVHERWEAVNE